MRQNDGERCHLNNLIQSYEGTAKGKHEDICDKKKEGKQKVEQ
jgi:uncharacterized protein YheU (UPF0270 family)